MTPQLQAAIAAIQPLSPTERRQLLQILTQSDSALGSQTDLRTLSTQFWQGSTLQQLHTTQTSRTIHNFKDLKANFWPEDSVEDFLTFLHQQRREVA